MTLIKTTGVVASAMFAVVMGATEAAAQAPNLAVSANGASVTIQWSGVAGALGYNLQVGTASGASNIASVNLPSSITRIVVAAPVGTYFLRVRGLADIAGSIAGPFSNEASVTVGGASPNPSPTPGPCTQPAAPVVSTNVTANASVVVSWANVPGASAYRVEYGRSANATDLVQNTTSTSHTQHVGMVGTFYVRVAAGNSCGSTTSETKSFTIEGQSGPGGGGGSGPRTPDPAPGTLLPAPSYGAAVAQQMANAFRGDLHNSCREHGGNNVWMFRLLNELRKRDARWGLNDKRGQFGDLSQDIISYNPTNRPDNGESQVYLFDVIGGHCGGSPDWNFQDVTAQTWAARGNSACGTTFCARWTVDAYLRAGFPADPR